MKKQILTIAILAALSNTAFAASFADDRFLSLLNTAEDSIKEDLSAIKKICAGNDLHKCTATTALKFLNKRGYEDFGAMNPSLLASISESAVKKLEQIKSEALSARAKKVDLSKINFNLNKKMQSGFTSQSSAFHKSCGVFYSKPTRTKIVDLMMYANEIKGHYVADSSDLMAFPYVTE